MLFKRDKSRLKDLRDTPIVPKGVLLDLTVSQIKPSTNNPRRLFDAAPLEKLKESIRAHGVLVPITVYKLPGQEMYGIVDGERRYRCCHELEGEGIEIKIPANVVEAPNKLASLIYMFNIHSFREQWELMPTALGLQQIIEELNVTDPKELRELTGLSVPQIERCLKILSFPKKYQEMSLDPDPRKRIPSNFWVELYPVLEKAKEVIPELIETLGEEPVIDRFVEKYRAGKIKSVIHFRRIMEAYEVAGDEGDVQDVTDRLREYILTVDFETRAAFDGFIRDNRRVQRVVTVCDRFMVDVKKMKIDYSIDGKDELLAKLDEVIRFAIELREKIAGDDPPEPKEADLFSNHE